MVYFPADPPAPPREPGVWVSTSSTGFGVGAGPKPYTEPAFSLPAPILRAPTGPACRTIASITASGPNAARTVTFTDGSVCSIIPGTGPTGAPGPAAPLPIQHRGRPGRDIVSVSYSTFASVNPFLIAEYSDGTSGDAPPAGDGPAGQFGDEVWTQLRSTTYLADIPGPPMSSVDFAISQALGGSQPVLVLVSYQGKVFWAMVQAISNWLLS